MAAASPAVVHSHISLLPPEVARSVAGHVQDEDLTKLRLVSHFWKDIANPFHFECLHIYFKERDYNHLMQVADHPELSKYVKELYLYPGKLEKISRQAWENGEHLDRSSLRSLPSPGSSASEREIHLYERKVYEQEQAFIPLGKNYSQARLDKAWHTYSKYYEWEERFSSQNRYDGLLENTLGRFPNLTNLVMTRGQDCWDSVSDWLDLKQNPYATALANAQHYDNYYPLRRLQTRSVMTVIARSSIRLRLLVLTFVDWTLFQDKAFVVSMNRIAPFLRRLILGLDAPVPDVFDPLEPVRKTQNFFETSTVFNDIVSTATHLEELSIHSYLAFPMASLKFIDVVQRNKWPCLRKIYSTSMDTTANEWLSFFERHQATIRDVLFAYIRFEEGDWISTLEQMQKMLRLEYVNLRGDLRAVSPRQTWTLGHEHPGDVLDEHLPAIRTRKALEEFMLKGGDCPLRDEKEHPQDWVD